MITLAYLEQTGGFCTYRPTNHELAGRLSLELNLGESESSQSRAVEAAQQLAADAAQYLGVQIQASNDPNDYPPTPEETAAAGTLNLYLSRAQMAPRIMARWASYNDAKLSSGEWPAEDFATFMAQVGPVVILLNSLAFGATAAAVQAFSHPLATEQAKTDYLDAMRAEGVLP